MTVTEIVLLASLLLAVALFWLRLETLQSRVMSLRDQLEQHVLRGHAPQPGSHPAPLVSPPAAPMPPLAPISRLAVGRPSRPVLRLVKD